MNTYRHTQTGYALLIGLGMGALLALAIMPFIPRGGVVLIVVVTLVICAILFSTLTVFIGNGVLHAKFGLGLIWKTVKLSEVVSCRVIEIRWWYGWGIHLTPHGWLCNVSGYRAAEITLRNGKRFCLGSDEPTELCEAITRAIA